MVLWGFGERNFFFSELNKERCYQKIGGFPKNSLIFHGDMPNSECFGCFLEALNFFEKGGPLYGTLPY